MKKVKSRSQFTSNPPASSRTKERSLARKSKPLVRDRSESGTDLSNVRIKDKQSRDLQISLFLNLINIREFGGGSMAYASMELIDVL